MIDYDMKIHSNPDAQAWAKFFIHTKEKASWQIEDIDESLMLAWFANAMMAMHDHLKSQRTWVGLTDEQIWQIATDSTIGSDLHAEKFARAIEAKLKENT
jgi:hypothetical protein